MNHLQMVKVNDPYFILMKELISPKGGHGSYHLTYFVESQISTYQENTKI